MTDTTELYPTTDPRITCSICDRSASVVCVERRRGSVRSLKGLCEKHRDDGCCAEAT